MKTKMTKKEIRQLITTLIGGAAGGFAEWYLVKVLATILAPKSIGMKIGLVVFGTAIGGILSARITHDLDEVCDGMEQAADAITEALKMQEDQVFEITASEET